MFGLIIFVVVSRFYSFLCKTCLSRKKLLIPKEISANLARETCFYCDLVVHGAVLVFSTSIGACFVV